MTTPKTIVQIKPTFLRKADALKYLGVGQTLFNEMASEFKLSEYRRGKNIVWYKVEDLDKLIEEHQIAV